jgi:hypothetical protein
LALVVRENAKLAVAGSSKGVSNELYLVKCDADGWYDKRWINHQKQKRRIIKEKQKQNGNKVCIDDVSAEGWFVCSTLGASELGSVSLNNKLLVASSNVAKIWFWSFAVGEFGVPAAAAFICITALLLANSYR